MKRPGKTPPFLGASGEVLPGSIAEAGYLRLGGVDQWVMIRGESVANPPLILLHGGPGMSETFLFRHFNAPLEEHFCVVYWDQRGAGRSFDRRLAKSSLTVEQLIADLDELVDWVRDRLRTQTVTLFGHSWGSALGVLHAARFPEKVAAYVGTGQLGDWPASERATYDYVIGELERRQERKALAKLRAIGPPPHDVKRLLVQRLALSRLEGRMDASALWQLGKILLGGAESSWWDLPGMLRGFYFSLDAMWSEVSALDLSRAVPALRMPVFFFLGRHDHWVAPESSVAYFERLAAPAKKLLWFEASGHEPFMDEPDKLNAAMVELVRPVVVAGGSPERSPPPSVRPGPLEGRAGDPS
jgi:pimeloyl-ACP methyl ester carboxylesterase